MRNREVLDYGMIRSRSKSSSSSATAPLVPIGPVVHFDSPAGGIVTNPATSIHGWLAVDGIQNVTSVRLVNARGTDVSLELVERADVREVTPGKTAIGFDGWIDIRTAADGPWHILYEHDGIASAVMCKLITDIAEVQAFSIMKARKLQRIRDLIRCPLCRLRLEDDGATLRCAAGHSFPVREDAFDLLDDETRARIGAVSTANVSNHGYDETLIDLISRSPGPILDVGAGLRPNYREDVINVEIVPYPTTDVVGASEFLPFADDTFDLVISVAVLEHVRDPFAAARELQRVLKPGGRIFAAVPFLQPYHGYPNHYYNMTSGGLRNLFNDLEVERLDVPVSGGPVFALTWILQAWRKALPPATAAQFDKLRVSDLAVDPALLVDSPFVRELPRETNVQLAALNVLIGRKPDACS